jgi:competence protein ComEC
MRPSPPRLVVPSPVALWISLCAGHLASSLAPVPALLEPDARIAAAGAGALSIAAAFARRRRPRSASGARTRIAERIAGWASLLLAGLALGAESDRAAWPLPVHPSEIGVTVEGRVLDTAAIDAEPPSVLFEARRVEVGEAGAACRSRLLLRWRDGTLPPRWILPGLWLRIRGSYRPPEDARNPGGAPPGRWLISMGIAGTVAVDPLSLSAPAEPPERGGGFGAMLRDQVARGFAAALSPPVAALARGMLLGDRSGIEPGIRDSFRDGGTIHILSISGLHVCILAGFLSVLATALRLPCGPAIALELVSLWAYVALVGAPASAVRSAVLWTAVRCGRAWGQVVRPFTAWGLAGLTLHLLDPASVLDPGFQLSFAAVLGLGASGALSRLPGESRVGSGIVRSTLLAWGRGAWSLFLQSGGATAGTMGIQSRLFGAVPMAGLFLNLAVIPLCTLFMAEAIFYVFLMGSGARPLIGMGAGALELSGLLLLAVNQRGAALLAPWVVPRLTPVLLVGAAIVGLLAAWARNEAARGGDPARSSAVRWSVAALVVAALVPLMPPWPGGPGAPRDRAVLLAMDVGQGDAAWVALPGGGSVLIDAGPADEGRDAGNLVIEPVLRGEGRGRPTVAVLSHAHLDHFGGFAWLARRGWIGALIENGSDPSGGWRVRLRSAMRRGGGRFAPLQRDTSFAVADRSTLDVFRGLESGGENDRSLAATLRTSGVSILFAGDLESAGEDAVLPRLARVQILKAPHHGSRTSSGQPWVDRLKPRIVLVSCGERNRFGHPDPDVLDRYRRSGAAVWRTDQEGAVRVMLDSAGAWISTRKHPAPVFVSWRAHAEVTPSRHIP